MKQIIIVDDDAGIRDIFRLILQRAGYNVILYANGDVLMGNQFELPDLFIIDRQLSGIDGLEICRFLKAQFSTKNIPVIIISASPFIAASAAEAGADAFVEKPFKTKALVELMKYHLNKN
ncbi:MAG: response regulator [Parafilimonas sp.]